MAKIADPPKAHPVKGKRTLARAARAKEIPVRIMGIPIRQHVAPTLSRRGLGWPRDDLRSAKAELSRRYLTSESAVALSARAATASPLPEVNVTAVGIGEKISDGQPTGALSVKLFVQIKLPKNAMAPEHLLPQSIAGLPVDVEEVGVFAPLAMPNPRVQITPAPPGSSVGFEYPAGQGMVMAGTFGAIVHDAAGDLYVLSNNHVLADESRLKPGAPIYQTGLLDLAPGARRRQIAALSDFKPYTVSPLKIDAAIAKAIDPGIVSRDILYIGPPQGVGPAAIDMVVHKFGRTTGYTAGRVASIATDATVQYETGSYTFVDQIVIQGLGGSAFSAAGDSGSLILDRTTNIAVGLLFGGSPSHTLANHLVKVLQAFKVELA